MSSPQSLFDAQLERFGAEARHALTVPNQVTVYPGGKTFSTIQAAIDSIPPQTGPDSYSVFAGPGEYVEKVTMKPWIMLMGDGPDKVTIKQRANMAQASGVVTGASNSGVGDVTVLCEEGSYGDFGTALYVNDAENFHTAGAVYKACPGKSVGINLVTVQIDLWANKKSTVLASSCQFLAESPNEQSSCSVLGTWNSAEIQVYSSVISATGGNQNYGVTAGMYTDIKLNDSTIVGSTCAIFKSYSGGEIIATHCKITGHVSPGVIIRDHDNAIPLPTMHNPGMGEPFQAPE